MEIHEITTEHKMSITIANDRTNITLSSEICFVVGESLYVEPFVYEGALLNFDSKRVKVSMLVYEPDKSPFMWQLVHVEKGVQDGKVYHVITSAVTGNKVNRRSNFRQFIGIEGTVSIAGGKPIDIMVKDISFSGYSILVDMVEKTVIQRNDMLMLNFYDKAFDSTFNILGRVVRTDQTDKYKLFGCKMTTENPVIDKYIANKQLEKRVNSNRK